MNQTALTPLQAAKIFSSSTFRENKSATKTAEVLYVEGGKFGIRTFDKLGCVEDADLLVTEAELLRKFPYFA